jgi:hypothetical protein
MRFMLRLFLIYISLNSLVFAFPSQSTQWEKIQHYLQKKIPEITWLDVNPVNLPDYDFAVRYYPCTSYNQQQLDKYLPAAIKNAAENCRLRNHGVHVDTEGYCTLENITLRCK